ncbi:MAG: hypothetical protein Fues2KO_44680 [Fuerstiella sp.]
MRTHRSKSTDRPHRSGFTLLELLAVITIISILLALIFPAISNVLRNANNAEVNAEFMRLGQSITSFESEYNLHPWSHVILKEEGGTWDTTSKTRIRRIWPQFNFGMDRDINGDGDATDTFELTASECLVFFLGGVPSAPGTTGVMGFSKNPINPFSRGGTNRTVPHEFDVSRLVDTDGDGMWEYADTVSETPLIYVCSNNGQGYSTADGSLNYYMQADGATPWKPNGYQIISAGEDQEFGFNPAPNPFDSSGGATDSRPRFGEDMEITGEQADNLVSFRNGKLGN